MDVVRRTNRALAEEATNLKKGFHYIKTNRIMKHTFKRDVIDKLNTHKTGLNVENNKHNNYKNVLDSVEKAEKFYKRKFSNQSKNGIDIKKYTETIDNISNDKVEDISFKDVVIWNSKKFSEVVDQLTKLQDFYKDGYKKTISGVLWAYTFGWWEAFRNGDYNNIADQYQKCINEDIEPFIGDTQRIIKDIDSLSEILLDAKNFVDRCSGRPSEADYPTHETHINNLAACGESNLGC